MKYLMGEFMSKEVLEYIKEGSPQSSQYEGGIMWSKQTPMLHTMKSMREVCRMRREAREGRSLRALGGKTIGAMLYK